MIQTRLSVFETNSSSTHSLTLLSPEEWSLFKSTPDMLMNQYGDLVSYENAVKSYRSEFCLDEDDSDITIDDLRYPGGYFTFRDVDDGWYGAKSITTPEGYVAVSLYCSE